MWAHFLGVLGAFLALGLIVAFMSASHGYAGSYVYGEAIKLHTATPDTGLDIAREGAAWCHSQLCEATVWSIIVVVLLVVILLFHWWMVRR